MLSNLKAKQIGLILVFVPVLIELIFVAVIAKDLVEAGKNFHQTHHVKTTIMQLNNSQNLVLQNFFILSNPAQHGYEERREKLQVLMEAFSRPGTWGSVTAEDNPELKQLIEASESVRQAALKFGEGGVWSSARMMNRRREAVAAYKRSKHHTQRTVPNSVWRQENPSKSQSQAIATTAMEAQKINQDALKIESSLVKQEPEDFNNLRLKFLATILFGFILNVVVSIALLKILVGNLQKRLRYVTDRGQLLALGQPLSNPLTGHDELAEVDRVITEASNVLAQFRWTESAVLDNSADVICSLDDKMRFVNVGASSLRLWNCQPEDLLRKSIMSLITAETTEFTRTSLEKIKEETGEGKFENSLRLQDGTIKDALWTVTWSSEKQNFYCVVNDVTELRAVDRMKKRFMAMASHDIRSPLNSIAIILATLTAGKRGDLPENVFKELERANANSQRLMALVNDFLELEKLESHKFALDLGAVAASEVCNVAKDSLAGLANAAKVSVVGPKNDAIMIADERRLVQVVVNLLSNAIKFSPANSTIKMFIESDENMATIKISDEGPGIDPDEQHIIFDKFQQTRAKSEVNMKGTGLGLAIVKNIVEAHGGHVGVISQTNAGSTFWITIPRLSDDEEQLP